MKKFVLLLATPLLLLTACSGFSGFVQTRDSSGRFHTRRYVDGELVSIDGRPMGSSYGGASQRVATYQHTFAEPPPSQSETAPHVETVEEKRNRLAVQLGISLGVKIGTRPEKDDDLATSFIKVLASSGADYLIEATIDEAFPEESPSIRREVSNVVEALFEGDFTLSTMGDRNDKQALIDFLQQRSPDAAQNTEIIDFLYRVYQGAHSH